MYEPILFDISFDLDLSDARCSRFDMSSGLTGCVRYLKKKIKLERRCGLLPEVTQTWYSLAD